MSECVGAGKSRGLLRALDNSLPARTKEAESGGVRVAELFTQSRSLPLYGAPTFHWHLTFVFKESKVTKRPLSPLLSSLSSLSPLARDQRASNCKQKEEFVCVCRLYAKTGIFAECIPLRVPVGSPSQKTSALFLMTFSSAIFLPSKVANPFSSFHWCLKLPGLFSFFTRKGHGHAIFLPHPSPSMLWAGGA